MQINDGPAPLTWALSAWLLLLRKQLRGSPALLQFFPVSYCCRWSTITLQNLCMCLVEGVMRNDSPITDLIRETGCLIGDNRSCTTLTLNRSILAQHIVEAHCCMLHC